ncbi:MAG: ABC transporter substrate-binding protein [Alkalilacustris sp.]
MTPRLLVRPLALAATAALMTATTAAAFELNFRLTEDPESLYGVETISLTASETMGAYITERLVYIGPDGQPQPWLAEGWEVSDDQTEITFTLRTGVQFHDGTAFDAAAVKAQFDAIMDPANASPILSMLGPLAEVAVIDDTTVRFTFDEPFAPFFNNISAGYMGINSPTAVAELGSRYGRNPVGTGPYRMVRWTPGTRIELERNDDFIQWRTDAVNDGLPHAERITLTVIREDAVALAALETGELSAAGLQADIIDRFVHDPAFNVILNDNTTNLVFLDFNQNRAPFDEPLVREALSHAVDRSAAVAAAWSGYASEAFSPLARGIPGFDADVAEAHGTPFDPDRALELLAEAGWTDSNGDGVLDRDGESARWVIRSYAGFTHIDRTLAVVQSNLRDIGIEVELVTSDWGAFYPGLMDGEWDMALLRWTSFDPGILTRLFRAPGHREHLLDNPEVDAVLDRCDGLMDPGARLECVSEAQAALLQSFTLLPILTNHAVIATQGTLADYTLDFTGLLIPGDVRPAD